MMSPASAETGFTAFSLVYQKNLLKFVVPRFCVLCVSARRNWLTNTFFELEDYQKR